MQAVLWNFSVRLFIFLFFLTPRVSFGAQQGWQLEVPLGIGGLKGGTSGVTFEKYVTSIYSIAGYIVGFIGVLMFMVGGFQYMIAAGNKAMSSEARKTMLNAAVGIALVLFSSIILGTINKDFVNLKGISFGR